MAIMLVGEKMKITTVLFDLDGTLLPMEQNNFVKSYFGLLAKKLAPLGYEPQSLIDSIWQGTRAMVKNDGQKTNEAVFWDTFTAIHGKNALKDIPVFDEFYEKDFPKVQASCGFNENAASAVKRIKAFGLRVALATNPIFPAIATRQRIAWAGLSPDDFELFTSYENSRYCKPNPNYYRDVISALGVSPDECLMVGNDIDEDMIAETLGMKVFLMSEWLINKNNADISNYPQGGFDELVEYVKELI